MNTHVKRTVSEPNATEIAVRVEVLLSKPPVVLFNQMTGVRIPLPEGTNMTGVLTSKNGVLWVHFPGIESGIELSKLKKLWDDLIVDAWHCSGAGEERELV